MMNWYPVTVQVVEEETPDSFHCTIRDKRFCIPRSAINPETRCVLGECDASIEIRWSSALEMGLPQFLKTNRDSGRPENKVALSHGTLQSGNEREPVGGVVTS